MLSMNVRVFSNGLSIPFRLSFSFIRFLKECTFHLFLIRDVLLQKKKLKEVSPHLELKSTETHVLRTQKTVSANPIKGFKNMFVF